MSCGILWLLSSVTESSITVQLVWLEEFVTCKLEDATAKLPQRENSVGVVKEVLDDVLCSFEN